MLKQANKDNAQLPVAVRGLQRSVVEFTCNLRGQIPVHIFASNKSWCLQISKYQIDLDIKDLHLFSYLAFCKNCLFVFFPKGTATLKIKPRNSVNGSILRVTSLIGRGDQNQHRLRALGQTLTIQKVL